MTNIIGLKEFRASVPKFAGLVAAGHSFVVLKRSRPLFKITPMEEEWEEVVDFTKIKKGGVSIKDILKRL